MIWLVEKFNTHPDAGYYEPYNVYESQDAVIAHFKTIRWTLLDSDVMEGHDDLTSYYASPWLIHTG